MNMDNLEKKTNEIKLNTNQKAKNVSTKPENSQNGDNTLKKKQTRLCLEATREGNFSDWYSQVITKSEFIDYSDISGCYILLESPIFAWRRIQNYFDRHIRSLGVCEAKFPLFVTKEALMKEKDHIADFSPEVAWVTMYGDKVMEKPIAVRPTSETIIYPYFAKKLQSYHDLPLKYNQWCNVVRWEFKNPVPLLRSREFDWQEGHTAFASREEAVEEVYQILDLYADVYKELLAIPVVKGRKTEKEKFAGADFTTTTEIYIAGAGRAIQGATSHHLGQSFSKMFDVKYTSKDNKQEYAYQNSWGMTTRSLGIMVMMHSDNKGLVLPPRVAITQVVIVPCGITVKSSAEENKCLIDKCLQVKNRLLAAGCEVVADTSDYVSPGWKFNHWEMKGVPIRIEIGPKDLASNTMVLCYRYTGEKETVADSDVESVVMMKMEEIQQAMYDAANKQLNDHRTVEYTMHGLCKALDKNMLITAPFCGDKNCEDQIKTISARDAVVEEGAPSMGAKSLCIPLEQPDNLGDKCVNANCKNTPKFFTMFGRSY